ncbi:EAL domain-containing protein [Aeromonas salmonicida]|uniref:EAL domain-containing protein n=1 Tax=Aeromonas salmonicida TaxID=645 RepID=UPI003D08556D
MSSLRPVYMPIVCVQDKSLLASEALLRLGNDPVAHIDFLTDAEASGEIFRVDSWMLQQAAETVRQYGASLAVNVSPVTITSALDVYLQTLAEHRDAVPNLIFEITETRPFFSLSELLRFSAAVRDLGGRLSLDDFGAGYASLDLVPSVQPDFVKLSKEYLDRVLVDPGLLELLRRRLPAQCSLIAEHIDSDDKMRFLRANGVQYAQGYLIGRPKPLENLDIQKYLKADHTIN